MKIAVRIHSHDLSAYVKGKQMQRLSLNLVQTYSIRACKTTAGHSGSSEMSESHSSKPLTPTVISAVSTAKSEHANKWPFLIKIYFYNNPMQIPDRRRVTDLKIMG